MVGKFRFVTFVLLVSMMMLSLATAQSEPGALTAGYHNPMYTQQIHNQLLGNSLLSFVGITDLMLPAGSEVASTGDLTFRSNANADVRGSTVYLHSGTGMLHFGNSRDEQYLRVELGGRTAGTEIYSYNDDDGRFLTLGLASQANTPAGAVGIGKDRVTAGFLLDVNGNARANDFCLASGTCLSGVAGGTGFWSQTGSALYANDNAWNIGVGKTNPAQKLDVAGMIVASGDICANYGTAGQKCIISGGSTPTYWSLSGEDLYPNAANYVIAGMPVASRNYLRIKGPDNTNPAAGIGGDVAIFAGNGMTDTGYVILGYDPVTTTYSQGVLVGRETPSATRPMLDVAGSIVATGTICDVNGCIGTGGAGGVTGTPNYLPMFNAAGNGVVDSGLMQDSQGLIVTKNSGGMGIQFSLRSGDTSGSNSPMMLFDSSGYLDTSTNSYPVDRVFWMRQEGSQFRLKVSGPDPGFSDVATALSVDPSGNVRMPLNVQVGESLDVLGPITGESLSVSGMVSSSSLDVNGHARMNSLDIESASMNNYVNVMSDSNTYHTILPSAQGTITSSIIYGNPEPKYNSLRSDDQPASPNVASSVTTGELTFPGESYQLDNIPATTYINRVVVSAQCKADYEGPSGQTPLPSQARVFILIDGVQSNSGATSIDDASWQSATGSWSANPATGQRWTDAEVNRLQAGLNMKGWYQSGGGGPETSFAAGTKVTMNDGSLKDIEDIKEGDTLVSYDLSNGNKVITTVIGTTSGKKKIFEVNSHLRASEDHPVYVMGKGYIRVQDLEVGDVLLGFDKNEVVRSIKDTGVEEKVYDLSLDKLYNFFADGILVHNAPILRSQPYCTSLIVRVYYSTPAVRLTGQGGVTAASVTTNSLTATGTTNLGTADITTLNVAGGGATIRNGGLRVVDSSGYDAYYDYYNGRWIPHGTTHQCAIGQSSWVDIRIQDGHVEANSCRTNWGCAGWNAVRSAATWGDQTINAMIGQIVSTIGLGGTNSYTFAHPYDTVRVTRYSGGSGNLEYDGTCWFP